MITALFRWQDIIRWLVVECYTAPKLPSILTPQSVRIQHRSLKRKTAKYTFSSDINLLLMWIFIWRNSRQVQVWFNGFGMEWETSRAEFEYQSSSLHSLPPQNIFERYGSITFSPWVEYQKRLGLMDISDWQQITVRKKYSALSVMIQKWHEGPGACAVWNVDWHLLKCLLAIVMIIIIYELLHLS